MKFINLIGCVVVLSLLVPSTFCEARFIGEATSGPEDFTAIPIPAYAAKGIVVEEVDPRDPKAKKTGLQTGDILLSWSRGDIEGRIETPFDLNHALIEQANRATLQIRGLRGTETKTWELEADVWGIAVRPNFSLPLLSSYSEGQIFFKAGKPNEAAEHWRITAVQAKSSLLTGLQSWLLFRAAGAWVAAREWGKADAAYEEAIQCADAAGPAFKGRLLQEWARTFRLRSDWVNAEKYHQQALRERQKVGAETLSVAMSFGYLGALAREQDELEKAEVYYRKEFAIQDKLAPDSLSLASTLGHLGSLSHERGDLAKAEQYYQKALTIQKKNSPASHNLAALLTDLGMIMRDRDDLSSAEAYHREALTILETMAPDSLDAANTLINLGDVLFDSGDLVQAEQYYDRSLAIRKKLAPARLDFAESLDRLGELAQVRSDRAKAEEYYHEALAIKVKAVPGSLTLASTLKQLADVLREGGDLSGAEENYRQALAIQEKLAANSKARAGTLIGLADIMYKKQQLESAALLFNQAFDALENQTARLGGTNEDHFNFRAKYEDDYKNYIDLLMEQKQPALALQVLERSHARSLLDLLVEAHLDIHRGVDSSLLDREHALEEQINAKSNRRIRLLGGKHTEEQVQAVNKELDGLLAQHKQIEAQIRVNGPGYAALIQPQPLSVPETQELLDADTMLLEYSLGKERSYLWALTPDSLSVSVLPSGVTIEAAAQQVYDLLTQRNQKVKDESEPARDDRLAAAEAAYPKAASKLSEMVLGPVASKLAGKRLLIIGDGALLYIPFALLPVPAGPGNTNHLSSAQVPLVVEHEVIHLPSVSVLALLRRERMGRKAAPKAVAVLADPVFDAQDIRVTGKTRGPDATKSSAKEQAALAEVSRTQGKLTRSLADSGLSAGGELHLARLPFTRREARAILAVTPVGQGMDALDFRASRATAISSELAQYRIVHFATHGLLDSEHPDLSGLVLSLVDERGQQQNGFLELQDIYNMNLPAELVVLSGCETGLGKQINGEGLVGLTRGFMYAGATRVVASLWKVDDVATAELMRRFYAAMEQDARRPAAALRQAQIEMWKQHRWTSPYYWAAFELQGEWK